jgi:nicotinamidase-related amidase
VSAGAEWVIAGMADTALLVVDMLNAYRHADAEELAGNVADVVEPLSELISRARDRDDVELIYVNDNYGDFTAEHPAAHCLT